MVITAIPTNRRPSADISAMENGRKTDMNEKARITRNILNIRLRFLSLVLNKLAHIANRRVIIMGNIDH